MSSGQVERHASNSPTRKRTVRQTEDDGLDAAFGQRARGFLLVLCLHGWLCMVRAGMADLTSDPRPPSSLPSELGT